MMVITIRRISRPPQPHIVQAAMVHIDRRSSEDACFQSGSL
jgi:hypothetical protein